MGSTESISSNKILCIFVAVSQLIMSHHWFNGVQNIHHSLIVNAFPVVVIWMHRDLGSYIHSNDE